ITDGVGNITGNPLFANPAESDYHILPGSPCINAGDPDYTAEPGETDLDGLPRVIDGRIDIGAYEYPNITPVACIVGTDRIVECEGCWGARITLDGSCSSDSDSAPGTNDDIVSFDWYKVDASDQNFVDFLGSGEIIDCNIPVGEHIIVLEVIDKAGTFDTNEVTIIVQDTAPPEFALSVNPTTLWPPNKKMVKITPIWMVSDTCDAMPRVSLVSISINEGGTKDNGRAEDDVKIGDDGSIYLRAERNRDGKDRIYTITYRAVDDSENATVRSATVTVPHKRR
ncbi:MAG: choice-of-anchor Q domain-containing protein, partial [Planctomycetota bacterium]